MAKLKEKHAVENPFLNKTVTGLQQMHIFLFYYTHEHAVVCAASQYSYLLWMTCLDIKVSVVLLVTAMYGIPQY